MRFLLSAVLCAGACATLLGISPAAAQDWPARSVRMVVPWPPGGLVDIAARTVAKELQASTGQPFIVDNKPGAGGVIGADIVAKASPDGYTIALTTSALNMGAALGQKLPFDVANDFAPIGAVAYAPSVVVINLSIPANSMKDLIALARSRPGRLSYASAGIGSPAHLATELFKSSMSLEITHVPYKGAPQAITDLIAGHVDILFANAAVALPQIKAGTVRPLAVTGAQRFAPLPDLPTVAEMGVKDFDADQWLGILAPRTTAAAITAKLRAEIDKALTSEALRSSLSANGMNVAEKATLAEFSAYFRDDLAKWTAVAKRANIKAE